MARLFLALSLALGLSTIAQADQVINDNLIVSRGGLPTILCVGRDCVNNESFSGTYDATLRLRALNTVIEFDDTSASTSPNRDWHIRANETTGGDAGEAFFIRDATSGTNPFYIEGAAPSNSLFVRGLSGRVGIGTSLPQSNLHVVDANLFASIRLEETYANPQVYQIAVESSAGFEIGDITALRTPFAMRPRAPQNSLLIESNGNVGLGTGAPAVPLHVRRNTGTATDLLRLENNGGVVFRLKDTSPGGQEFTFQSNGGIFRIASPAVPGPEFTMDDFGNVVITGQITTAGSCSAGCDRVFSEEYDLPRMEDHHAAMWAQGYLPNVGPTPEDGPFNLTEKVGGMLNELEHAHIFIAQQQETIAEVTRRADAQAEELAALKAELTLLASQISQATAD